MRLGGEQRLTGAVAAIKVVVLLYLFLLSIALLGTSFKALGSGFAEQLVESTSNPLLGLIIGLIVTSIVQSSSVTTSLIVGLVGGGALSLSSAIPMVMGANIGTTVTNMLVSLGQITRKNEFRRAFSAAVIHDSFNVLTVIVLFPIQVKFDILGKSAEFMSDIFVGVSGAHFSSPIKAIVKPTANLIDSLVSGNPWILIIIAAALLFVSLNFLVKTLKSVVVSRVQVFFDRVIFKNAAISLLFGLIVTVMVQSSSITTSLIVPLAGAGLLNLWQVLPYTLGANVGTTVTAILASLATGEVTALAVAFAHLLFNVFGIIIIWPFRVVPIRMAEFTATLAVRNRAFPIAFVAVFFYAIPLGIVFLTR
jgi:sodium-dependent phosphate cotransporter